ncbi:MAG: trypsin-like peptidase domain-containing protein [Burkholderiales bacterium]|jgi:S1-C subfamily serine protease|nr:trypsin-like peptidase domain-containing protein [Burkholderiales bacterium]
MKRRTPLYSRAPSSDAASSGNDAAAAPAEPAPFAPHAPAAPGPTLVAGRGTPRRSRWQGIARRYSAPLWMMVGGLIVLALVLVNGLQQNAPRKLTQKDIDKAVLHTLNNKLLPSPSANAYEIVRPSVVLVREITPAKDGEKEIEEGVGTGVVITESGMILTNLHVVAHANSVKVLFYDGSESEATVVNVMPEHDLAVLKARVVPDDTVVATLRSTDDLRPGEQVLAVGFPFGIGPTASAGVVSGLKREFRSPKGQRVLTNLIQFDAMANPGSSGGPLVTMDGAVVGIVTAILNPTEQRVFIGIGFAVPIENAASGVGLHPF